MSKIAKFKQEFKKTFFDVHKNLVNMKNDESAVLGDLSVAGIIGFAIGLIVLASVLPTAMDVFYNTNTTSWDINGQEDTKTVLLWWLIPLIVIAVVLIMLYKQIQ